MCAAGGRVTTEFDLGNLENEAREAMATGKEQGVAEEKEPER